MKKFIKILLSLMLACITAVTFASCKWDGEIKEPKIKGDLMTEAEVDAWVEDYKAKAEDMTVEGGWYKFNIELNISYRSGGSTSENLFKITGKIYNSANENEIKYVMGVEGYATETEDGVKTSYTETSGKAVYIDGVAYTEMTVITDDEDGHSEETEKIKDDDNHFDLDPTGLLEFEDLAEMLYRDADIYEFRNGITISKEEEGSIGRLITEFKRNSAEVKSLKFYLKLDVSNTKLEVLGEMESTLFGSVKAPKDADEYKNERY